MLKEKRFVLLAMVMLAMVLSGCIISATPKDNPVIMQPGVPETFSITTVFPTAKSYTWYIIEDGVETEIAGATNKSYTFTLNDILPFNGWLKVVAVSGDDSGTHEWSITYAGTNTAPIARCNISPNPGMATVPITLDGSLSSDLDNNITGYLWEQTGGPATVTIVNPTALVTQFTTTILGTYTFKLTVTDEGGLKGSTTGTVTVETSRNITITQPTCGITWNTDEDNYIKWESTNAGSLVKIEYYYDGNWYIKSSSTANDGSARWTMDDSSYNNIITHDYTHARIRITSIDYPNIYAVSCAFTINHVQ